jgi:hypothetical protein
VFTKPSSDTLDAIQPQLPDLACTTSTRLRYPAICASFPPHTRSFRVALNLNIEYAIAFQTEVSSWAPPRKLLPFIISPSCGTSLKYLPRGAPHHVGSSILSNTPLSFSLRLFKPFCWAPYRNSSCRMGTRRCVHHGIGTNREESRKVVVLEFCCQLN